MHTAETLWPRPVLERFEHHAYQLRSRTDLGVHLLPNGSRLDTEPVRHVLFSRNVGRDVVTEICDVLGRARTLAVDLEPDQGLLATRAVLTTGPMTGWGWDATWLALRLRTAPDGLNEKLTVRIGAPVLGRESLEIAWGYGCSLRGRDVLNSEDGVLPGDMLHMPLRLVVAYSGLLRAMDGQYRLPVPQQSQRDAGSVVRTPAFVSQ